MINPDKPVVTAVLAGAFFYANVQSAAGLGRAGAEKSRGWRRRVFFVVRKAGGAEGVFVVRRGGVMSDSAG